MSYYSPSSGSPHYRRGGRPSFSTPQRDAPRPGDRDLLEGLHSTPLQTLAAINRYSNDKEVLITNLECVGSYSWVEKASPTIIVPGSPRKWRNRATPYQVQPDVGTVFKDQNGYRMPKAVLFPLFKAVDEMEGTKGVPKVDWKTVDFVTDRNNLRKLLRWIIGGDIKDFRIDTQLVGKTILLNRWEQRYREEMPGYTYGFNFEKESTIPATGCEMASGHHRILIYDMNGLKIVVRHEVDACIPVAVVSSPQSAPKPPVEERKEPVDDIDDLVGAFSSVKIKEAPTSPNSPSVINTPPSLSIISAGSLVPQSSIVELTTRSMKNAHTFDWKEAYGQLWLSQTPHHFLARHERGRFTDVQKRKLSSMEMKEIVSSHETIKYEHIKLRRLLDVIKQIVVKHGEEGRLSFVCKGGQLQVYERINKDSCLPEEVKKRFTQ